MEYVDEKIIEGFGIEVAQQLSESVEFAVQGKLNDGERDPDELRQVAQDALTELMVPSLIEATAKAYEHSPLKEPDFDAIAMLFGRLAVRAKLKALPSSVRIRVRTRSRMHEGALGSVRFHDEVLSVQLLSLDGEDEWIPVDSIQEVQAVDA